MLQNKGKSSMKGPITPPKTKKVWSKKINGAVFTSSQDASLPHNHEKKDFFMMKYGQFLFHCFKSREKQIKWIKETKAKGYEFEVYEVLYVDRPCSFYADIEVYCPENASYIDDLTKRIMKDFTDACEKHDEHDLRWTQHHRKTKDGYFKVSFHVRGGTRLYKGVVTHGPLLHFAEKINEISEGIFNDYPDILYDLAPGPRKISILDMRVYTKNRPMGLIGSAKNPGEEGFKPCDISKGRPIEDFLICNDIPREDLCDYTFVENIVYKSEKEERIVKDRMCTIKVAPTPQIESLRVQIQEHLTNTQGDPTLSVSFEGLYGPNELLNFRVNGSNRFCNLCNKSHNSNGAYVKQLKSKDILYTCLSSYTSIKLPIHGRLTKKEPLCTISPPDGRVPDLRNYTEKCISVIAGMNTGKTYRVNQVIESYGRDVSILVVTCRKSMASGLQFRFKGFDLYTKDIESDRLICEYESLHHTRRLFDLVIIDEVRSILSTSTMAATNKKYLLPNMERLKKNMEFAKKVFLMDADSDVDGAVRCFMDSNFTSTKEVRLSKPIMPRKYILRRKHVVERDIITDIKSGKKVVISFGSKMELEAMAKLVEKETNASVRTYTSESPHKDELYDVEKYWAMYGVIMYTGVVTVALDFNGSVYRVYCFPRSTTMSPREMIQSLGRSRNVETNEIVVSVDAKTPMQDELAPDYDMEFLYENELEKIMARRDIFEMMEESVDDDGKLSWAPKDIAKIWAYNIAEQSLKRKAWISHFRWILRKKGLQCIDDTKTKCKDLYFDLLQENKLENEELRVKKMDEIDVSELDNDWYMEKCRERNDGHIEEDDLLRIRKYEAQRYFNNKLSGSDVLFYENNKRVIWNQLTINKLDREDMEKMFKKNLKVHKDFVKTDLKVIVLLEDILKYAGFKGYYDRESLVDMKNINGVVDVDSKLDQIKSIIMGKTTRSSTNSRKVMSYLDSLTGIHLERTEVQVAGDRTNMYSIKVKEAIQKVLDQDHNMMTDDWIADKLDKSQIRKMSSVTFTSNKKMKL